MAIQTPSLELGTPLVQATAAAAGRGYWKSVARRLRRDPVTVICAAVLLLLVASALAAPWLGLADPYKTSMLRRLRRRLVRRTRRSSMSSSGETTISV